MEYLGFIFGIFGLMAYLQLTSLKGRISELERQLTGLKGTSYYEDRRALLQAARSYMGRKVRIELKEDREDTDIHMYGNTKHGSNQILDADEEWLLVRGETPKGSRDKLIRLSSVSRISVNPEES